MKNQVLSSKTELEKLQAQLTRHTADRKRINSQIHYTGQYFANKDVYSQFVKSTFKGKFRKEHASEIQAYEEARDWLKSFLSGWKHDRNENVERTKKQTAGED